MKVWLDKTQFSADAVFDKIFQINQTNRSYIRTDCKYNILIA
jgi:hypothetical protein